MGAHRSSTSHYVYILQCSDGSYYTGATTDLEKRLQMHNGDLPGGARYTRSRRPVTLVYVETFATRKEALQREAAIKAMSRKRKERLLSR